MRLLPFFALILILLFQFCSARAEKNYRTNVIQLISDQHLQKYDYYQSESGLFFTSYENTESGDYLLIAQNKKLDTLLIYSGDCAKCFYDFYPFEGTYILQINRAYKIPEYEGSNPVLSADQFFIDSMKYFEVDTNSLTLQSIPRLSNDSMVERVKYVFNMTGDFSMVHLPLNKNFTIEKDTLKNSQVYYDVQTNYELKKIENQLTIEPQFFSTSPPYYMGIYVNRTTFHDEFVGCTESPMNFATFCLYSRTFTSFSDTLRSYGLEGITHTALVVKDNNHHVLKTALDIPAEKEFALLSSKEKELNAGVISELRIDLFNINGNYFITTFLPYEDEFMDEYPPVYYIDTLSWMLHPVLALNASNEKKTNRSRNTGKRILSENFKNRADYFCKHFDIDKIDGQFRLLREK